MVVCLMSWKLQLMRTFAVMTEIYYIIIIGKMDLQKISIVLVRPEESRNIGSVCRAMANSGISDLRIVGNKPDYDEEKIRVLAIHAYSLWESAKFFQSINEAVADCTIAAGTTRRRGKKRKGKLLFPEEFAVLAARADGKTAVIFGNERTGLTDDELEQCTVGVTIPVSEKFASLNLSHAVQIMCYTLFRESRPHESGYTPLPLSRIDETVQSVTDSLAQIGFFKVAGRHDMEKFWRAVLSRAAVTESEAKYIEKIFDKAAGLAQKNSKK